MKFIIRVKRTALLFLFLLNIPLALSQENLGPNQTDAPKDTQLVVIASMPFITDMLDGLTSAHLRTMLASVRPNILAIKSPANVNEPLTYESFDLQKVIRPWAKQQGIKAVPISYYDLEYPKRRKEMFEEFKRQNLVIEYNIIADRLGSMQRANKFTFKFINSSEHDKMWRLYHADMRRLYRKDTPWHIWNRKIVDNLVELCSQNPGKRIAVVINSPHCYFIKDAMAKQPGVKLITIENSLDFSKQRLEQNFLAHDYIYALRPLANDNFGNLPSATLTKLETYIHHLGQYPEFANDAGFFRGKMLLHRKKNSRAVSYFRPMTNMKPDLLLEFDNSIPVRDLAMIYTAMAEYNMGNVNVAVNQLKDVIKMDDISEKASLWANNLLESLLPSSQAEVDIDITK